MLKGSLRDVSLPGLLQFLANESGKNYHLKIERGSTHGELVIAGGSLISAAYGLLTGEDALCEFLTWADGVFFVERLPPRLEATFDKNINLKLQQAATFADQACFLLEDSIGLNTVIRPSRMFGTPEWQESSKLQPLKREDFLILGWLSEGRTMRQAMREFSFDLVQATGILYRLALTRSVEVVRPGQQREVEDRLASAAKAPSAAEPPTAQETTAPLPLQTGAAPAAPAEVDVTRRTTVLPIIATDIERLLGAGFTITEFGFLALKNPMLDENIRFVLLSVEEGKTVQVVVEESSKRPATTLSTYRYCLERGYVSNPDPVLPLTADLLLGRTELDQYLLQRRRVTGDQLRDLVELARTSGLKLSQVLIDNGFLSSEDLSAFEEHQRRFLAR